MRSDSEIRDDVEAELRYDPDMANADIAVSAKDGVVTLAGFARSYLQKWEAGQGDHPVLRADRDVGVGHVRVIAQLRFHIVADFGIGSHDGSPLGASPVTTAPASAPGRRPR